MFRRLSLIILISISLGITLAISNVYAFNNSAWSSYQEAFQESRTDIFNHYVDNITEGLLNVIASHAYWTEAIDYLNKGDSQWLSENDTTYILDMGLFSTDYILVANESLTFYQENGAEYKDEILIMPQVLDALNNDVPSTFFTPLGTDYAIVTVSPFYTNDGQSPTGLYVAASVFDENRLKALFDLMGKDLVSLNIYDNNNIVKSAFAGNSNDISNTSIYINVPDTNYLVEANFDLINMFAVFQKQRNYTIYIIFISASFVAFLIIGLLWIVTSKIRTITQNVIDISEGDYDTPIEINNSSLLYEMNRLSKAVGKMAIDIKKHLETIDQNYLEMVDVIINAVEINDRYTSRHNIEVGNYARIIAEEINYINIDDIILAAKLHDIGKISIHPQILNKPGRLTPEEYEIIKTHPLEGYKIIQYVEYFDQIKNGVKYHHEHWDGTGYPDQLKGNEIPLIAQIISIADAYDAMTSDRSYRKGMPHQRAAEIIISESGKFFNPLLVEAFVNRLSEFEAYYLSIKNER